MDAREQLRGYLEDYLHQRGLSTRKAFRCLSPGHEDKHPSMSYNKSAHNVHCFACGVTYDLFDLIGMDYRLDNFPEQLEKAAVLFGVELGEPRLRVVSGKTMGRCPKPHNLLKKVEQNFGCEAGERSGVDTESAPQCLPDRSGELDKLRESVTNTYDYFLSRGISKERCETYGLFQTADRAYFPITQGGVVTGWCGRALTDEIQPRYKNSNGPMSLWNGDLLTRQGGGRILCITEGVVDALILGELGYAAIALCGSQNGGKLLRLAEMNSTAANSWRFLLCGDGDEAGHKLNGTLCSSLRAMGLWAAAASLPEGEDVASLYKADAAALSALLEASGEAKLSHFSGWDVTCNGEHPQHIAASTSAEYTNAHKSFDLTFSKDGGGLGATPPGSYTGSTPQDYAATSAAAALDGFLQAREARGHDAVATGVAGLDKLLDGGLHPGLYVMGAISSLGKTSLALQMADYIAGNERDVLFVTLEQSSRELMAKSLSRLSAELDENLALTVRELLGGGQLNFQRRQLLRECGAVYGETARGLFFREGLCDIGAGDIREMVREHLSHRGQAPVVMVDYLQILCPADSRATDKQNVDRAVVELKCISRDFDIPVLCISSFNRENYKAAVSMEAFKESGAVEYSADVLLGLQLQGAGEKGFDVNAAKVKSPRALELVLLKNRNGVPWAKVPLCYDAAYNRFWEPARAAIGRFA